MTNNKMTIATIRTALNSGDFTNDDFSLWQADERHGVQKLLAIYERKQALLIQKQTKFVERLSFEQAAWEQGIVLAGVDEVGRGPLAGPVVAGAVVIDETFNLLAVHDSKQLSEKARLALDAEIKEQVVAYAFGVVDATEIDEINIYEASRVAMKQAVEGLAVQPDGLLVDAMVVDLPLPQEKLIKGDDRSISIGAASILAKNYRDQLMTDYAEQYPGYGFEKNAGYGTKEHLAGLAKLGPTPIHRRTFAPVKKYLTK